MIRVRLFKEGVLVDESFVERQDIIDWPPGHVLQLHEAYLGTDGVWDIGELLDTWTTEERIVTKNERASQGAIAWYDQQF